MKYIKFIFTTVFSIFTSLAAFTQQVPMYSQYVMNGFLVNPSLAGRDGYTTVNITTREQWAGMSGSPSTYAASFQTSLIENSYIMRTQHVRRKVIRPSRKGKIGLGGYIFNDNNGIIRRTGFQADYAYHISVGSPELKNSSSLSFGLAVSLYQYYLNEKGLIYSYDDDPYLQAYDKSVLIPDVNFGVSYSKSDYYLGFSMTNILRGSVLFSNSSEEDKKRGEIGHYFLTGGYSLQLDKNWSIKPSFFIKSSDMVFKSAQLDLTARFFYQNDYWAGISYRTSDAIIMMMGLRYSKFYFAYAFDLPMTEIRSQCFGTHEITMAVKFGDSSRRYKWLNSF